MNQLGLGNVQTNTNQQPCTLMRRTSLIYLLLSAAACTSRALDISSIDYAWPEPPKVGDNTLHILTTNLLELKLINTKPADPAKVTQWDFVKNGQFVAPRKSSFAVTADGKSVSVKGIYFKRRPFYGPFSPRDLRIENSLYLLLASSISDNQVVEVKNPNGQLWPSTMIFKATKDPLRFSPATHVNQEGYMPNNTKKAMVGYYAGNLGEMGIPASAGFKLVDANSGVQIYQGSLVQRRDSGYTYSPLPYQQVYEADFSTFNTPGEYRLVVPGLGGSLPFLIHDGIAMSRFHRTVVGYSRPEYRKAAMPECRLPPTG